MRSKQGYALQNHRIMMATLTVQYMIQFTKMPRVKCEKKNMIGAQRQTRRNAASI